MRNGRYGGKQRHHLVNTSPQWIMAGCPKSMKLDSVWMFLTLHATSQASRLESFTACHSDYSMKCNRLRKSCPLTKSSLWLNFILIIIWSLLNFKAVSSSNHAHLKARSHCHCVSSHKHGFSTQIPKYKPDFVREMLTLMFYWVFRAQPKKRRLSVVGQQNKEVPLSNAAPGIFIIINVTFLWMRNQIYSVILWDRI